MVKKLFSIGLVLLLYLVSGTANASRLNFDSINTFTGTAPAGSLSTTFSDVSGSVQMQINSSLGAGENLDPGKALYLNINPVLDSMPGSLSFTGSGSIQASDFTQSLSSSGGSAFVGAAPVPIPGAIWLFVSGLVGLGVFRNRSKKSAIIPIRL